jgi:uncharacterized protein
MIRLILLAALVLGIIWLLRPKKGTGQSAQNANVMRPDTETMARCEQCGVHFPASEAILKHGHSYCCEQHASS